MTKTIMLGLVVLAAAACNPNAALKPKDPSVVSTITEASLPGIYAGSISDFQVAWSGAGDQTNGAHEGNVGMSAIFTDELTADGLDEFIFRQNISDRVATPANTQLYGIFSDLSAARHSTETAAANFAKLAPKDLGRAEVMSLEAYTYVLFAEIWCAGVPFSELNTDGSVAFGDPLTTPQMLGIAIQKFDSATALAAGDTSNADILALSRLGKARALLDSGAFDAAGATADSVLAADPTLNYQIDNSLNSPRQFNGVWQYVQANNAWGVVNRKGGNGLDFMSANDPRVLWIDSHTLGSLSVDTVIFQLKYPQKQASATLGSATEAALISAERDLHDGNIASWATKLNTLRTTSGLGLAPLPADSTTGASSAMQREVHFRERAFWLWLTGSRLGDLRRLLSQYHVNDFPDATGSDIRFPVPLQEDNNPKFHGCLDSGHET